MQQNQDSQRSKSVVRRSRRRNALHNAVIESLEQRQLLSDAVVSIAAIDSAATEAAGNPGKYRLTRDVTTGALDVTVTITGTATNGTDYTSLSTTVSFANGSATADVALATKEDTTYEGSETVIMTVVDDDGYTADEEDNAATITITDNEKPTISIEAGDDEATEEDDEAVSVLTVSRDGPTDGALTVKLTIAGTATNGTDYETVASTVVIPDGEESVDIEVVAKDDSTLEGTETVKVTIAADATKYGIDSKKSSDTVNIADDEVSTVKIAASDATALEGSTTDTGKFTITRTGTGAAIADALVVKFAVSGTATDGTDYDTLGTTATIPAGKSSVDVTLKTKNDTTVELGETAIITLSTDDAYAIDGASKKATVAVKDDDKATVTITASDATATESGTSNTGKFTVTRTGATTEPLTVSVTLAGTATKGTDYKSVASTVVIPVGKTTGVLEIKPKDDLTLEGTETVIATLAAGTTYIIGSDKTATAKIEDDELPEISFKVTDAKAIESGTDKGTFTVTRTGPTTAALVVDLAISGTAEGGDDYTEIDETVTIPVGKSSATITVAPTQDTDLEGSETVIVGVTESEDYDLDADNTSGTVTIADDDKSTVTITATDASAAEASSNIGKFTVTRTGTGAAIAEDLKVSFTIAGTATKTTDYAAFDGFVIIPAGSTTKTITVTPVDDSTVEANETVIVTLAAGATYTVGSDKAATVTIAENDKPTVTLTGTDTKAAEPSDKGTLTFTRNGPTTEALEVSYSVDGTADADDDYTELEGTVTIPVGKSSITVTIETKDDTDVEGSETVIISTDSDSAYIVDGDKDEATVTITDNEKPTVTLTVTDDKADEDGESEEEDSAGTATFKFARTGPTTENLDVFYTITGTSKTGTDTTDVLTGKITIPSGSANKTLTITGKDDDAFEGNETLILTMKAGTTYTVGTDKTGTATIVDNDLPMVSMTSKDLVAKEGTTDGIVLTFTRTGVTTAALAVDLTTSGTAVGADFAALPSSVTIPAGKTFVTLTLTAKDDSSYEGSEDILFAIATTDDYTADEDNQVLEGKITDKQLPTVSLEAADDAASETSNATGKFTFSRAGATTDPVVVAYTVTGSAKNGKDYTKIAKTVTIPAGEESVDVTITPRTDALVEGSETVILTLAKGDYTIDSDTNTDTVTIGDAQKPTIEVEALTDEVDETDSSGVRFRIWRDGITSGKTLTVLFALTGTAELDDDYTIVDEEGNDVSDGSVTIAAGESYVDLYVKPVDNSADASDKTVIITLSTNAAYDIGEDVDTDTITILDDDASSSVLPTTPKKK